jgi:hypothetical protein
VNLDLNITDTTRSSIIGSGKFRQVDYLFGASRSSSEIVDVSIALARQRVAVLNQYMLGWFSTLGEKPALLHVRVIVSKSDGAPSR